MSNLRKTFEIATINMLDRNIDNTNDIIYVNMSTIV